MAENQTTDNLQGKSQRSMQIVVFRLGQESYGMQIDHIKEVVLTPAITRMPQTPSYVKGVANIRGNVIAIFDLEERFDLARNDADKTGRYTLVVQSEDVKLGLLVREVPNTITVSASEVDESVGIVNDASAEANYVKGIIKSRERLIILIDIFKVIEGDLADVLRKPATAL